MATKSNIDADKHCKSCMITNCLNRNCGCFAADRYCTEACSCKECFNRLDHLDKVRVARNHALQRNSKEFSTKEGQDTVNLTVQKQKKGCACRKIMCIQEHCKCFKNGVGCGDECRCEGCINVYGYRRNNADKMIDFSL